MSPRIFVVQCPFLMRFNLRSAGFAILLLCCAVYLRAQAPIGEVFADDASVRGSVLYAGSGTRVLSGSQVAAGSRAAVLKLSRGGEIRICPGTSVSVAASPNGRNLLFSLNQGNVEFHFDVRSDGDALQTPDFRVQFIGPAHFDLALCTDKHGGLAMRGKDNRAAVIVSEMMGDGVYQVSAGSSIDFENGSVANPKAGEMVCGCPETEVAVPPQMVVTEKTAPPPPPAAPPTQPSEPEPQKTVAAAAPAAEPVETHVQVDAPFIFHGGELPPDAPAVLARMQTVSTLALTAQLQPTVTMPERMAPKQAATEPPPQKKSGGGGFFRKIGSFFGKIFR